MLHTFAKLHSAQIHTLKCLPDHITILEIVFFCTKISTLGVVQ